MRFVPYNHAIGTNTSKNDGITDSEYETDSDYIDKESGDISSKPSTDDVESMTEILANHGLSERFNLSSKILKYHKSFDISEYGNDTTDVITTPSSSHSDRQETQSTYERLFKPSDVTQFITDKFVSKRQENRNVVEKLIREEQERLRKIEEEKQRKIEEARQKKLEEERRIREEKERLEREEAERKRIEEENRLKREAAEKKMKELAEKKEKEMKERIAKEQELKKQKEAEIKKAQEAKILEEASKNKLFNPKEIEKSFIEYHKQKEEIENTILNPVANDKDLKKIVGAHKRKINPKFGQLTNSQEQLSRITNEIHSLVVQTQQNQLAYRWILNFIANAIISQAETEVSVKPKSSIPLAKLTLNLMIMFPELSGFMLTKFYTSCPLLFGYTCSQDTEEGRVRMGWNRDESSGKWESETSYNERLTGISTLYAVISRLKIDHSFIGFDPSTTKHPIPICNSWTFLARMVNLPPPQLTEIHFVVIGSWWDACCTEFIQAYGKQAYKLLNLISTDWSSVDSKSSAGRVRIKLLAEELTKGTLSGFPNMVN